MRYILKRGFFLLITVLIIGLCLNYHKIERIFYPRKYSSYVEKYSKEYKVDKYLVYSIIKTESKFNPKAVSSKKASGLMQITEKTSSWLSKELALKNVDIFDPQTNIMMGTWYLHRLKKEFKGDMRLMISAYNGGSGNVKKWLKSSNYSDDGKSLTRIPFKETSEYTEKVLKNYKKYKEVYEYH